MNECMNFALRCFLHNHGNMATEVRPKPVMPYSYSEWLQGFFYSAQYHRQHCILHAFEQFGALYMHNHDDK